jgi:hypothetical protein
MVIGRLFRFEFACTLAGLMRSCSILDNVGWCYGDCELWVQQSTYGTVVIAVFGVKWFAYSAYSLKSECTVR